MTALILKLTGAPRFNGLDALAATWRIYSTAFIEAQAMARAAQRRYPFAVE
jgi:hypothetical protein